MTVKLAPRPANEEQRVKAVIKTGLIDAPDNTAFQVYCELAKDITEATQHPLAYLMLKCNAI